jgi:RimJ/RimL family protein N-acetyltransferase
MRQAAAPIWYCTKWIFNKIITEQRLWRVQAAVRCDFPAAMSFARKLGFVMEGCMKHYCMDRTDAFLYAYTREVK